MTPDIVQNGAAVLRKKAAEVPLSEIGSAKIKKVLKDMEAVLEAQDDGVALAAPQIGVSLRIFIVAKAALSPLTKGEPSASDGRVVNTPPAADGSAPLARGELKRAAGYLTFINPVIVKLSRGKALLDEGCLSVRPLYGKIKRARKASVKAYDENGRLFERGASGLLAQIFQHECDHLDGVLFVDKATDLKEMLPDTAAEVRSKNPELSIRSQA